MTNLNSGRNSKKSQRMNRAAILSPPVIDLIFASAHLTPSSVSVAVTNLAPCKPAKSVGCCSVALAMNAELLGDYAKTAPVSSPVLLVLRHTCDTSPYIGRPRAWVTGITGESCHMCHINSKPDSRKAPCRPRSRLTSSILPPGQAGTRMLGVTSFATPTIDPAGLPVLLPITCCFA